MWRLTPPVSARTQRTKLVTIRMGHVAMGVCHATGWVFCPSIISLDLSVWYSGHHDTSRCEHEGATHVGKEHRQEKCVQCHCHPTSEMDFMASRTPQNH